MLAAGTHRGSAHWAGSDTAAAPPPGSEDPTQDHRGQLRRTRLMSARSLSEAAMDKYAETLNCAQSESNPNLIGPPSMRRTLWFAQRPICAGQLPHDGSEKISAALMAVNLDAMIYLFRCGGRRSIMAAGQWGWSWLVSTLTTMRSFQAR